MNQQPHDQAPYWANDDSNDNQPPQLGPRRLVRTRDRMLGGVCGGIARQFNVDPTIVRVLTVIGTVLGLGSLILVYLVLWIVMPSE